MTVHECAYLENQTSDIPETSPAAHDPPNRSRPSPTGHDSGGGGGAAVPLFRHLSRFHHTLSVYANSLESYQSMFSRSYRQVWLSPGTLVWVEGSAQRLDLTLSTTTHSQHLSPRAQGSHFHAGDGTTRDPWNTGGRYEPMNLAATHFLAYPPSRISPEAAWSHLN